jgi:phage baseplate assembly protein V
MTLIKKAKKVKVFTDSDIQTAQIELFADEFVKTEQLEQYGMTSVPPAEVGVGVVAIYDERHQDKSVLLGWFDGKFRPKSLENGEVCFYSEFGQKIKFSKDGKATVSDQSGVSIVLNNDNTITINAQTINFNAANSIFSGDVQINENLVIDKTVKIGESFGSKTAAALQSDSVINASDYQIDNKSIQDHTHTEDEGVETSTMNL